MPRQRQEALEPGILKELAADFVFGVTRQQKGGKTSYLVVTNLALYLALRHQELLGEVNLLVRVIPKAAIPMVVRRGIHREHVVMRALYPRCNGRRAVELVDRIVAVQPELFEAGIQAVTREIISSAICSRKNAGGGRV